MIDEKIIQRVEELKHHTVTAIDNVQKCCCPMIRDMYLKHQYTYNYKGYPYHVWQPDVFLFAAPGIPYCYDNSKNDIAYKARMIDLVEQDKVFPFLLFVNNKVIPWSRIIIIRDHEYSYLWISDTSYPDDVDSLYEDYVPVEPEEGRLDLEWAKDYNATILYFPIASKHIIYGEDENYSTDSDIYGLYFENHRLLVKTPEFQTLSVRFEFRKSVGIYFRMLDSTESVLQNEELNKYMINFDGLENGKIPTISNIIAFDERGTLIGSNEQLKGKIFSSNENGTCGYFFIDRGFMQTNAILLEMYYDLHTVSVSYPYTKELAKEKVLQRILNPYETGFDLDYQKIISEILFDRFDFNFMRDMTYDRNMRAAMKYIVQYDYALWNKIFIEESPIKSFTYTGREFKRLADNASYVRFSRRHTDLIQDRAMMFVNSEIYEHSIDISYSNNTINIPAFGILDEDVVEVVLFTKCNNNILNVVFKDNVTPVYINPSYNLDDCYIMDDQNQLSEYPNTPESPEGRRQYICEMVNCTKDENSNYTIHFQDVTHYGRTLKIVPKNQFRYYRYRNEAGQHKIILPQQFNYCHDIDRYIIFVNGRKIDKTEYTVTIMNKNRPFDKLVLYLSTILDGDDRVDIFYVPEYLHERYKEAALETNGLFKLSTKYPKMYALSKNTCMIFVNGYKINPMDIRDINMNQMAVSTKYKTIHNVTVVEYIEGSKELAKYLYGLQGIIPIKGDVNADGAYKELHDIVGTILSSNEQVKVGIEDVDFTKYMYDKWTELYDRLAIKIKDTTKVELTEANNKGVQMLYDLYDQLAESSIIKDYKEDYTPLKAILYDIIVDFYVQRNGIQTGTTFAYDFEMQEFGVDPDGNNDITLYPDHDKLLDYAFTEKQTAENKVLEDKSFIVP